jgi:hypothetical protein
MRHITLEVSDVPTLPPSVERRAGPADRRRIWRGGRRDSDWVNRPSNALANLEMADGVGPRPNVIRRAVSSVLHLW